MIKILPYKDIQEITVNCWHHWHLGVLLNEGKYMPWYVERFINLSLDTHFELSYTGVDSIELLSEYDEVLEFNEILDRSDTIKIIIDAINNNKYVHMFYDRFFIKGCTEYQKESFIHGMFVIGYDDEKKLIFFSEYGLNRVLWGVHSAEFSLLDKAFKAACDSCRKTKSDIAHLYRWHNPMFSVQMKEFSRNLNVYRLYKGLCDCLNGEEHIIPSRSCGEFDNPRSAVLNGVSIYKGYSKDLYNVFLKDKNVLKSSQIVVRTMKSLIESKYGLLFRVEYLADNGYIESSESLKTELKGLINTLEEAFYLMVKCSETLEKRYFEEACVEFERAEKSDRSILAVLCDSVYLLLKNRI